MDFLNKNNDNETTLLLYGSNIIERFCGDNNIFIAGEIGDKTDLDIISYVANSNKTQKFIFVPHEISEEKLNEMLSCIERKSILFSECTIETDFNDIQVLIIDFLGSIPLIYKHCRYAYIGMGTTPDKNNLMEATSYGIPFAFRSTLYRKDRHAEIINHKIGTMVHNGKNLDSWFKGLKYVEGAWKELNQTALKYAGKNTKETD